MLIQLAAHTCNTIASLLGHDNNQVVLLKIPATRVTEDVYVNNFVTVLTNYAKQAGIPIKPLETWQSRHLFEYSRKYHYKGAQVSSALKKISRLSSEANQVIPTLNGDLSGLYSTGASAAAEDVTPGNAYRVTLMEAMHMLRRSLPWLRTRDAGHTVVLAATTRTLGGLPVTIYPNFCMRAIQDQLSTGLHWARTLCTYPHTSDATKAIVSLNKKSKIDYDTLVKDPSSLPLIAPLLSEHYLRDVIKSHLPKIIKNRTEEFIKYPGRGQASRFDT